MCSLPHIIMKTPLMFKQSITLPNNQIQIILILIVLKKLLNNQASLRTMLIFYNLTPLKKFIKLIILIRYILHKFKEYSTFPLRVRLLEMIKKLIETLNNLKTSKKTCNRITTM